MNDEEPTAKLPVPPEAPEAAAEPADTPAPPAGQSAEPPAAPPAAPAAEPSAEQTAQLPPYAAPYGTSTYATTPPRPDRPKRSGLRWPGVAVVALLVGLAGGVAGGAAWEHFDEDPVSSYGGLADVETVSKAPLPADNGSIAAVAEKLLPATVEILAQADNAEEGGSGSGFVLDTEGHVVTNNHVVAEAAGAGGKVTVVNSDGERFKAEIVGRSSVYDIAVLKVDDLEGVVPAALGTASDLRVGEGVVALGAPQGLASTVTSGIVSALNRPVSPGQDADGNSFLNAIQTDAAINPGNSGGPLVDMTGRVVGINSAILSVGSVAANIGIGFAIPVDQVRVTVDQILKDGEARYPIIGATVNSDLSGDGAHVQEVGADSPAAKAGLSKGDVINAIDGRRVTDNASLIVAIRSHLPGEEIELTVVRDGKERTVKLTLDSKVG